MIPKFIPSVKLFMSSYHILLIINVKDKWFLESFRVVCNRSEMFWCLIEYVKLGYLCKISPFFFLDLL